MYILTKKLDQSTDFYVTISQILNLFT